MNTDVVPVQDEALWLPEPPREVEPRFDDAVVRLRATLDEELSGAVDRLMSAAVAEANAAIQRACAAGQTALDGALAELLEQVRQRDCLTERVRHLESQLEELRLKLDVEVANAKLAEAECEKERTARTLAEAARDEAQALRQQLISVFDLSKQIIQAELDADAEPARNGGLQPQLGADRASENDPPGVGRETRDEGTSTSTIQLTLVAPSQRPSVDPPLDLVEYAKQLFDAPSQRPSVDAPLELVEYVKQLFNQICEMYWVDYRAHGSFEVVSRLSTNLRLAHEVFARRVGSGGGIGETLFEEEFAVRLDTHGATSLGRHLGIAAYELWGQGPIRAQAS